MSFVLPSFYHFPTSDCKSRLRAETILPIVHYNWKLRCLDAHYLMRDAAITSSVCRSGLIRPRSRTWPGWMLALPHGSKPDAPICVVAHPLRWGGGQMGHEEQVDVLVQVPWFTARAGRCSQTLLWSRCETGSVKTGLIGSHLLFSPTYPCESHASIRNTEP